jgi:hypothetical protein
MTRKRKLPHRLDANGAGLIDAALGKFADCAITTASADAYAVKGGKTCSI